jgi:hypothetical protein
MLGLLCAASCARPLVPPGPFPAAADPSRIAISVFLIGDAGEPAIPKEPVLEALSREIARDPRKSLVMILGDNVYPEGIDSLAGSPRREEQERRLRTQLDVLLTNHVRGIVIPGNHDWARHKPTGLSSIKAQEAFVEEYVTSYEKAHGMFSPLRDSATIQFLPRNGCPGPAVRDYGRDLRVIVLDTQWWLHPYEKPGTDQCKDQSGAEFVRSFRAHMANARGQRVLVVSHHPIETASEHGGFFDWKAHLFPLTAANNALWIPLPFLGSFYPMARMHGFTPQDLSSVEYCEMAATLDSAFTPTPPLLFASGHDHGLQVMKGGRTPYAVVSGGGRYKKENPVTRRRNTVFSLAAGGFMRLDIMKDDSPPRLGVFVVDSAGGAEEKFAMQLDDNVKASGNPMPRCREQPGGPAMSLEVPGRAY